MNRSKWVILAAVAAVAVVAAVALSSSGDGSGPVDNETLRQLALDGARVVDVRSEGEFVMGHIPDADNVPLQNLAIVARDWDPAEPVVVYCAVGSRSADAHRTLVSMGFERVYDLTGGIAGWDGEIVRGAPTAPGGAVAPQEPAAEQPETAPSGSLPVMYEFSTDS